MEATSRGGYMESRGNTEKFDRLLEQRRAGDQEAIERIIADARPEIPVFPHALAVVDAAHQTGWSFQLSDSVFVSAGDERFPLFSFRNESKRMPKCWENDLLKWWAGDRVKSEVQRDKDALLLYRSLGDKKVTRSATHAYDDGHTGYRESGITASGGYILEINSTGGCRFAVIEPGCLEAVDLKNWACPFEYL
jgi:hypothetical protein